MESDDLTAKLHESVRDWEVTKTPNELFDMFIHDLQAEVDALKARIEELERQVAQRNTMNAAKTS